MDEAQLYSLLETTGLPVAYHHFVAPPAIPYIVYLEDEAEGWGSDERNEIRRTLYLVELYTKKKDPTTQRLLESLFDDRGIKYKLYETYIESENLYQAVYHVEFVTKIRRSS